MIAEPERPAQPRWWRQELALLGSYLAPRRLLLLMGLLVALTGGLVVAYQFPPAQYFVNVGAADADPYITNFHAGGTDGSDNYRITDYYSYVTIPGTGSLPYTLTLRLDGSNPTNLAQPLTTTVFVGGQQLYSHRLAGGWQELSFAVNQQTAPAAYAARDVVVELRSQTYNSPDSPGDSRGPRLAWVRVTPTATGFIAPNLGVLLRLIAFAALLYLLLAWLGTLLGLRATWLPLTLIALTAGSLVALMIFAHQGFAIASADLLITVAASYIVLLATGWLLGAINHAPTEAQAQRQAPAIYHSPFTIHHYLVAIVVIAFAIKFGGMDLPQTIVKDMPWHLRFINVVKDGGLEQLLQPGVLSVTPKDWDLGSNALVPKSPLFYVVMAPLTWLPGELAVWVKLVICLIDVSGALILYYLARRLLPDGERIGLLAAAVYLLTPLSYRVLSFGTLPTIFAQWLTLLAFAYLALNLPRLHRPLVLLGQSLLLALVLLSFPTMVLFTPLVLGVVFIGGFFIPDRVTRRNALLFLPLSGILAASLAVLLYYGRYIRGVVQNTLPAVGGGTTVRGQLVGDKLGGWGGLLVSNITFYGSLIPFILALVGLILLFRSAWSRTPLPSPPLRSGREGNASPPLRSGREGNANPPLRSGREGNANPPLRPGMENNASPPLTWVREKSAATNLQSTIYNLQSVSLLLLGWLLILPLFYAANYWLDMIGKHLLYTMYPLALASGIALAYIDRLGRWGRWLVWLLLTALAFAAGSLWLERIVYGGR